MPSWARSTSRSIRARMTRRIWSSTSPPIANSVCLSASSSSWKCRGMTPPILPEPPGDVIFGPRVARVGEERAGHPELHQLPEKEEAGRLRDPGGLLHVVRDDHDRQVLAELEDQLLDLRRRDGIERRARFVHQQPLGPHGQRPGDAEALLLAAGEARPRPVEPVLHLVPERRVRERALDGVVQHGPVAHPRQPEPRGDRSEEHTSELQSLAYLVCRLLLEKKKNQN